MNKSILEKCVSGGRVDHKKMCDELQALTDRINAATKTGEHGFLEPDAPFILFALNDLCKTFQAAVEEDVRLSVLYKLIERSFGVTTVRVHREVNEEK